MTWLDSLSQRQMRCLIDTLALEYRNLINDFSLLSFVPQRYHEVNPVLLPLLIMSFSTVSLGWVEMIHSSLGDDFCNSTHNSGKEHPTNDTWNLRRASLKKQWPMDTFFKVMKCRFQQDTPTPGNLHFPTLCHYLWHLTLRPHRLQRG